jgi:hypothetical protein
VCAMHVRLCACCSPLQSISGHSMGGHGALICALKNPVRYTPHPAGYLRAPLCRTAPCNSGASPTLPPLLFIILPRQSDHRRSTPRLSLPWKRPTLFLVCVWMWLLRRACNCAESVPVRVGVRPHLQPDSGACWGGGGSRKFWPFVHVTLWSCNVANSRDSSVVLLCAAGLMFECCFSLTHAA